MLERFTTSARQVVVLAQEEARSLNHTYVGSEHILLGLVGEEEQGWDLTTRVLESLAITVEGVRAEVVRLVGSGEQVTCGQIRFTPRAKKVLVLALREAQSLGPNHIVGTEHIMLGLVRENEGVAARILLDLGATHEKVREELRDQRQRRCERMKQMDLARTRLKHQLRNGRVDPAEILLDPPSEIHSEKVFDLLVAIPSWGEVRVDTALHYAGISPSKRVGLLAEHERRTLVDWLDRPGQSPLEERSTWPIPERRRAAQYDQIRDAFPGISTHRTTTSSVATEQAVAGKDLREWLGVARAQLRLDDILGCDDVLRRAQAAYDRLLPTTLA